jgi:Xaa-Pro aminopeptidase
MDSHARHDLYPHVSAAESARRCAAVRTRMAEADLAALIVYGTPSAPGEILYLADYLVTREAMLVFPAEGDPGLFVQFYNHVPSARRVASVADVRWGGPDTAETTARDLAARGLAARRIGMVGPIPLQRYHSLTSALPRATFVDFTPTVSALRLVKSEEEIAFLRRGAELSDRAIEALEHAVRPGLSEHDLVAIIEGAYLGIGGRTHIHYLASTSMRDPAICVPAQQQSNRVIERGDVLITEISAHYHGYPGQILRPFSVGGPPTPAYQRLYDVAVEAFNRLAVVIQAGATAEDVLDAADYIHTAGFTIYDDLVHGFGGGYLAPILRTRRTTVGEVNPFTFAENMTVVIQPNVITEDERMGVQVGELVRVTRDGVDSLHRYPMRFIRCG